LSLEKEKISSGEILDTKVLKQLYRYVQPYKFQFYLLVFLTISLALLAPTRPYFIQVAIDDYVAIGDSAGLVRMIYILVGLMILQAVVQWAHTFYSGWIGQVIIRDLRVKLFNHLLKLKLKFFDNTPIGRLVT